MIEPKNHRILIVDDEPELRKVIAFDFKRKGFAVSEAGNGVEALDLVRKEKVDLVLSDVRMPKGDGIDLLKKIKETAPEIPIVMFITGFSDLSLEDAYDRGAEAVFPKPFDRTSLMAAIFKAITPKEQAWKSASQSSENLPILRREFLDLDSAARAKELSIGRGGFFISCNDSFPEPDSKTNFDIRFQQGSVKSLSGIGTVRWVRSEGVSTGCGIEFDSLGDESRKSVIDHIRDLHTKTYIPKN